MARAGSEGCQEHLSESDAKFELNANGVRRVFRNGKCWRDIVCTEGYEQHLSLARHRVHRGLSRAPLSEVARARSQGYQENLSESDAKPRAIKSVATERGDYFENAGDIAKITETILEGP